MPEPQSPGILARILGFRRKAEIDALVDADEQAQAREEARGSQYPKLPSGQERYDEVNFHAITSVKGKESATILIAVFTDCKTAMVRLLPDSPAREASMNHLLDAEARALSALGMVIQAARPSEGQ